MRYFYIIILLLQACSGSLNNQYKDLHPSDKKEITKRVILDSAYLFSGPTEIILSDDLVIVHDSYVQNPFLHIFDTSGIFKCSLIDKGKGPNEIISPSNVSYNFVNKNISLYDRSQGKIICVNIDDTVSVKNSITKLPTDSYKAIYLKGKWLLVGNNNEMRFGIYDQINKKTDIKYTIYPKLVADEEENNSIWSYASKLLIKPDESKMVMSTYIGLSFEFFDISNANDIISNKILNIKKPIYKLVEGAMPKWVVGSPETIVGVEDLYVTDQAVYALIYGVTESEMINSYPYIWKFDWNGNLLNEYRFQVFGYSYRDIRKTNLC